MPREKPKWKEQMNRGSSYQSWEDQQKEKKVQKTLENWEEEEKNNEKD